MDETREGAQARSALRNHIGALYSCPTDLPVPLVREDTVRELSLKRPDGSTYCFERLRYTPYSSARCLVRQPPVQPSSNCCTSSASGDLPSDESPVTSTGAATAAAAGATAAASTETDGVSIAEVFCRVLPLRTLPSRTPSSTARGRKLGPAPASLRHATGGDERNANTDALLEALGTMYKGLQVVGSPQAAVAAGPGTTTRKEAEESVGGAEAIPSDAAQPLGLARPLVTCARLHAGLVPLYTPLVESGYDVFLRFACIPFRLTALTQLCRTVRGTTGGSWRNRNSVDLAVRFVFYQLMRVVDYLHSRGIAIGNLSSRNVLLTDHLWVQIAPSMPPVYLNGDAPPPPSPRTPRTVSSSSSSRRSRSRSPGLRRGGFSSRHSREEISGREMKRRWRRQQHDKSRGRQLGGSPRRPPGEDLPLTYRWVKGMVTNLEYLLAVNAAAGRFLGDRSCHPVVPWVSDLSRRVGEAGSGEGNEDGWRDLTMTKFRLKKGDAQLDKSYSEGNPPHHIPESLSELTLAVYLARRLPLQVLRDVVRSELVAEEYPASVVRMYSWTPDECVPEFYTDPAVFRSTHGDAGGLSDLEVPSWFEASPEDFVRYHRSLLEGERVTRNLHRWLDITFGYCLKGQAAVDNKNVPLPPGGMGPGAGQRSRRWNVGAGLTLSRESRPSFVQLFRHPHPPRKFEERTGVGASRKVAPEAGADTSETAISPTLAEVGELYPTVDSTEGDHTAAAPAAANTTGLGPEAGPGPTRMGIGSRSASVGGGRVEATGRGGGASIFGVAFDDYIGEEGVRPPFSATATGASADGARIERARSDGNNTGVAHASIEEERRALAFAYDVELRLDPWYGRPRSTPSSGLHVAETTSDARTDSNTSASTIRCDGDEGDGDDISCSDAPTARRRESVPVRGGPESADLLACGCILSELCAGEPVLAGTTGSERTSGSGGVGRADWLEAAVELPQALRSAIGALTHPDPGQRPSALALLSTIEPVFQCATSPLGDRAGRPDPAPPPAYCKLFPPYMHDVYAFLAALQQEETAQKRLLLAAAALPVLEVPIHAFALVVPHLVALLGCLRPVDEAFCNARAAAARPSGAEGRAGRSDASPRRRVGAQAKAQGRTGQASEGEESASTAPGQSPSPIATAESVEHAKLVPDPASEPALESGSQGNAGPVNGKCLAGSAPVVAVEAVKHAQAWVAVFDFAAARLGPGLASDVLLPPALTALEGIRSPEYACHLMDSHLWGVLAQRVGSECFLRHALPLLLAWLEGVVDGTVSGDASQTREESDAANKSVERAGNSSLEGGVLSAGEAGGVAAAAAATDADSASSRVQAAAAASVSGEVYEYLGPPLAARYLIPALVDCLGRLAIASGSNFHPPALAQAPSLSRDPPPVPAQNTAAFAAPLNDLDAPPRGVSGAADSREGGGWSRDGCPGDPASRDLFHYCNTRDATAGDPDLGIGRGESFLVLSKALGEMCLRIDTEEVTVPLVLSRLFHQIIPSLPPVLLERGGAPVSATVFRSVLEITNLLGRLLPTLCPETISHFYIGMRPAWSPLNPPSVGGGAMSSSAVTSVPWLLSAMPLPQPVDGLDASWSADKVLTGDDALTMDSTSFLGDEGGGGEVLLWSAEDDAGGGGSGLSDAEKARPRGVVDDGLTRDYGVPPLTPSSDGNPLGVVGDEDEDEDRLFYGPYFSAISDVGSTVELEEVLAVTALGPSSAAFSPALLQGIDASGTSSMNGGRAAADSDGAGDETQTHVSLQFVCHIEAARLLAATAMGVLREGSNGGEEYAAIFQAAEDFFSAFGRSYGGLVFSHPTMVAGLKLAREVYNPLASLFGFDAMRERVPSASRRIVAWLSRDLSLTRNTERPIVPWEGVATGEEIARSFRGRLGSGDAVIAGRPLRSFSEAQAAVNTSRKNGSENGNENESPFPAQAEKDGHWRARSLEVATASGGMYISPGDSPERDNSPRFASAQAVTYRKITGVAPAPGSPHAASSTPPDKANEENDPTPGGGDGEGTPVLLLGRLQQAIKQRLTPERSEESVPSSTTTDSTGMLHPARRGSATASADRHRHRDRNSRTKGPHSSPAKTRGDTQTRAKRSRGLPAWGEQSQDGPDSLLPPPPSMVPPPLVNGGEITGGGATQGQRVDQPPRGGGSGGSDSASGANKNLGVVVTTPGVAGRQGDEGGEVDDVAAALEWPSLLGAMGAKAPRVRTPPRPSRYVRDIPPSSPAPTPTHPVDVAGSAWSDDEFAHVRQEVAKASGVGVTTKLETTGPPSSPPLSPFLQALPSSLSALVPLSALSPLPPPKPGTTPFSAPPPLPGTCRGEGVEVAERLRERGWLVGTRVWGKSRQSGELGRGRVPGDGFDADAVGSLFPLEMALQTSFVAHPDKAPVTSMAVEARSESILITGSGEGEVRVWSLSDHPVTRLSGFRAGDSGGSSSGGEAGGGGRKGSNSARQSRTAITQLGIFEGAGRAAALDGLVRVWDVERSKGLAICHLGTTADAPPLTSFSLSGCGDGTTPPLDESEWEDLAAAAGDTSAFSAPDDQQLTATYSGGVVHYDCRQNRLGGTVQSLFPVAQWDVDARLQSLRARATSKSQTRSDTHGSSRRGDSSSLPLGLCSVCEGEGSWVAAGSGGGQVVVFDKRRPGGRPLFWWNAHGGAVVGVFRVARHFLLTTSRDRTAVLWDLSRSPAELSGVDSTGPVPRHPGWGVGAYRDESAMSSFGGQAGTAPVLVSAMNGLPDNGPGMSPATVRMLPLARPPPSSRDQAPSPMFGEGWARRGRWRGARDEVTKLPVLFAAAGDSMVASVVRRDPTEEMEEVHPMRLVGPSGKTVNGKGGARRSGSGGGLVIRSVAVLPLRRLSLLGCADGWVRVGT